MQVLIAPRDFPQQSDEIAAVLDVQPLGQMQCENFNFRGNEGIVAGHRFDLEQRVAGNAVVLVSKLVQPVDLDFEHPAVHRHHCRQKHAQRQRPFVGCQIDDLPCR
jgi:hypothetical protein